MTDDTRRSFEFDKSEKSIGRREDGYTRDDDVKTAIMEIPTLAIEIDEATEQHEATYSLYHGYTPTGGSSLQQSKPSVAYSLLSMTVILMLMLVVCAKEVVELVGETYESLLIIQAQSVQMTPERTLQVADLLKKYADLVTEENKRTLCEAPFFANTTSSTGISELVTTFEFLDYLSGIFFILGTVSVGIMLCSKLCVTVRLSRKVYREDNPTFHPKTQMKAVQGNVSGLSKELHLVKGYFETKEQRVTRVCLRAEVFFYSVVNAVLDIPLLTFVAIYYTLAQSSRGAACAACFLENKICTVEEVSTIPFSIYFGFFAVALSSVWNITLLLERWYEYSKYKREVRGNEFSKRKFAAITLLSGVSYLFVIGSPFILFVAYWIGPTFYHLSTEEIHMLTVLGWVGAGLWLLNFIAIMSTVGIDPSEMCAWPILGVEVCDIVWNLPLGIIFADCFCDSCCFCC